jgi:AcrR family transcriptional regulator
MARHKTPIPERLTAAAQQLFSSEGHSVTIDDIVTRAGVAKPTFYTHFASKEQLTRTVLERSVSSFFAALDAELARRRDPVERALAPFDVLVAHLPDPDYRGCICLNTAATFPMPDHMSHSVLREHDERLTAVFVDLAEQSGVAYADDLARQLLVLFDGVKARALVDPSPLPGRDARKAARTLLLAAT